MAYAARVIATRNGIPLLLLLVGAALLVTYVLRGQRPVGTVLRDNPLVQEVQRDASSPAGGAAEADLTMVVFADYRCPACRLAHPGMRSAVAADGKVRVVYKDWPVFGALSERAAAVAIASNFQGIYPQVHDRLMTGPVRNVADLRSAVEDSGGDWRRLQADLQQRKAEIDDQLARNRLQAFGLGLGGTPGYLIGPVLVRGAITRAEFLRSFREARQAS
jgi:protein-disulfide isomerase